MREAGAGELVGRPAEGQRLRAAAGVALVVYAFLPPCPAAYAQEPTPPPPNARPWIASVSHWGRWVALAGAAGLTTVAIARNHDADDIYGGLQELCRAGGDTCVLNAEGTYVNPDAEALYQETLRLDSHARRWMLGGQVMLVAAGAMFVVDLVAGTRRPKNIPYSPVEYFADGRRIGVRIPL